jgi:hypothetical protein
VNQTTRRTVLITGASAGIGKAFAELFAAEDYDLVLTARRRERLENLASQCRARHGVEARVVVADLADPAAPQAIFDELAAAGVTIDALVNNAGYGVPNTYLSTTWRQQADFIQVLVTAVAKLSHLFLPGMIERGWGRIINVSSVAGLIPGSAGHTLYGGAKAFLINMTESLAHETVGSGVQVSALCPGFTYSEFHDVTGTRELVNQIPHRLWLTAEDVARQGFDAVMADRPVAVTGGFYKGFCLLMRLLPAGMARRTVRRHSAEFRAQG